MRRIFSLTLAFLLCGVFVAMATETPQEIPEIGPLEHPLKTLKLAWGSTLDTVRMAYAEEIQNEGQQEEGTRTYVMLSYPVTLMDLDIPTQYALFFDEDEKLVQITTRFNTWGLPPQYQFTFFTVAYSALRVAYGAPDETGEAWRGNNILEDLDIHAAIFYGFLALFSEWVLEETLVTLEFIGDGQNLYTLIFYEDLSKDPSRMSELYPQLPTEHLTL